MKNKSQLVIFWGPVKSQPILLSLLLEQTQQGKSQSQGKNSSQLKKNHRQKILVLRKNSILTLKVILIPVNQVRRLLTNTVQYPTSIFPKQGPSYTRFK